METNNIGSITTALLKKCANWFLYIFIAADAGLPSKIMKKRAQQIKVLKVIDTFALFNSFQGLVNAVEQGIREKYGLSPVQVLSMIYNINVAKVSGIGAVNSGTYFDGEKWVDGDTGNVLPDDEQTSATKLAQGISSGNSDFWTDFMKVIQWIIDLFNNLGVTKRTTDYTSGTAELRDWDGVQESSMSSTVPYIVGGVVLYYLFTRKKKSDK